MHVTYPIRGNQWRRPIATRATVLNQADSFAFNKIMTVESITHPSKSNVGVLAHNASPVK